MREREAQLEDCEGAPGLTTDAQTRKSASQDIRRRGSQHDSRMGQGPIAYDVEEVMSRLGVTRPTIYRFLRSGELRSFRLGTRRLVSSEALVDFLRARETIEAG